jgi:hypothetical protein
MRYFGTTLEHLLRAAVARAAGQLETLDVSGCVNISHRALLPVVRANSASLRELHTCGSGEHFGWPAAQVEELLRAAPGLQACHAAVNTTEVAVARAVLRAEPPFAALRLECLNVGYDFGGVLIVEADAVLELAAAVLACTFMRELHLRRASLHVPAALDAVVDAALACRLHTVRLIECGLSPASAPALARLLGGGALAQLEVECGYDLLFDEPAAAVLANALRTCSSLTTLTLQVGLWRDPGAAAALLGALTGHASLRTLNLFRNGRNATGPVAGAALGALVGANAPALTSLDVQECILGDEGLRPLFDALPANTHLIKLECDSNNLTDAFACNVSLPAVRANDSLRHLSCSSQLHDIAAGRALSEAEALVAQRAAGR